MTKKLPTPYDRTDDAPLLRGVHETVRRFGRDAARSMVPAEEKRLVDVVAALAAEESEALGISHSGFALTSLPHRKLPEDAVWERRGHRIRLLIEPGILPTRAGHKRYGVPYGSRARMILFYLQTQAVRSRSREIELGRSLHEWLDKMGISTGGQGYADVREQAARIRACRLILAWDDEIGTNPDDESDHLKWGIVDGGLNLGTRDLRNPEQGTLWRERVLLNERFYQALVEHPVPLWEPALRQLNSNSPAIDIYVWLAWRLHSLDKPTPVSWSALHEQFGSEYARLRDFRKRYIENLKLALAVYEAATVKVSEAGLILYPSAPSVPEKKKLIA